MLVNYHGAVKMKTLTEFQRTFPLSKEEKFASIKAQQRITQQAIESQRRSPHNRYLFNMAVAESKLLRQLRDQVTYG